MDAALAFGLVAVVTGLSALQSVFGIGLLVFGTPTLLLLGMPFTEVLGYLLPCSIVISWLQVRAGGGWTLEPIRVRFLWFGAPAVLAGTLVVLVAGRGLDVRPLVGAMLMLTAVIRILGPARERVEGFVRQRMSPLLALMGLLHGLSNLGGGVLALIVGSAFREKEQIRKHIAFCYGVMASVQLATLLLTTAVPLAWGQWVALPALAAATYALVGRRMFRAAGQAAYQWGLTGLIGAFGVLLLLPA